MSLNRQVLQIQARFLDWQIEWLAPRIDGLTQRVVRVAMGMFGICLELFCRPAGLWPGNGTYALDLPVVHDHKYPARIQNRPLRTWRFDPDRRLVRQDVVMAVEVRDQAVINNFPIETRYNSCIPDEFEIPWDDMGLEKLVDQIHIGHRRVAVVAGQLDMLNIRPTPQQVLEWRGTATHRNVAGKVEHVHQIGCRTVQGAAMSAFAQLQRSEQCRPTRKRAFTIRQWDWCGPRLFAHHIGQGRPEGHGIVHVQSHGRVLHMLRSAIQGLRLFDTPQNVRVLLDERILAHGHHPYRGVQAVGHEYPYRRIVGRQLRDALNAFEHRRERIFVLYAGKLRIRIGR